MGNLIISMYKNIHIFRKILKHMKEINNYKWVCDVKRKILIDVYSEFIYLILYLISFEKNNINLSKYFFNIFKMNSFKKINYYDIYFSYFYSNSKNIIKAIKKYLLKHDNNEYQDIYELFFKILDNIDLLLFKFTKSLLLLNKFKCDKNHLCFYNYDLIFIQPPYMYIKDCLIKKMKEQEFLNIGSKIILDLKYFKQKVWKKYDDEKFNILNLYSFFNEISDFYLFNANGIKIEHNSILNSFQKLERKSLEWTFQML